MKKIILVLITMLLLIGCKKDKLTDISGRWDISQSDDYYIFGETEFKFVSHGNSSIDHRETIEYIGEYQIGKKSQYIININILFLHITMIQISHISILYYWM